MAEIAIRNVRDLGEDARRTLEALLGRRLAEQEQVSVTASGARPAPSGDARRIAAARLSDGLKEMSERAKSIPDEEFESLVDEAMSGVRRRRTWCALSSVTPKFRSAAWARRRSREFPKT
jgi:hypothetical protein